MGKRRTWTDKQLEEAIKTSLSWGAVIGKLGLKAGGGTYVHLQKVAKDLGYDSSHFTGSAWNVGERFIPFNTNKRPLQEYLDGKPIGSNDLKKRLWKEGVKQKVCECCGITEWMNQPAPLELDHIDGDGQNNKLDNLRILCANCHAQTDTYCGKNKRNRKPRGAIPTGRGNRFKSDKVVGSNPPRRTLCMSCYKEISPKSTRCKSCETRLHTTIQWPSNSMLIALACSYSFVEVGKMLGVSDNAVRKRLGTIGVTN